MVLPPPPPRRHIRLSPGAEALRRRAAASFHDHGDAGAKPVRIFPLDVHVLPTEIYVIWRRGRRRFWLERRQGAGKKYQGGGGLAQGSKGWMRSQHVLEIACINNSLCIVGDAWTIKQEDC